MQMNISGHHVEVTDALKNYVASKMEKIDRHSDQITSGDVILTVEKNVQRAEATIHVVGSDIHAVAESEDMYAAIDSLTDKLDRQIIKHKEKLKGHK
jgi:ribosomal subunit interface protein